MLRWDVANESVRLFGVALGIETGLNNHALGKTSTEDKCNNLSLHERRHLLAGWSAYHDTDLEGDKRSPQGRQPAKIETG